MATKYLFADESGNFDFRDPAAFPGATKYFAVGTLLIEGEDDRLALEKSLSEVRYELIGNGIDITGAFHATTDSQPVRDAVFDALKKHEFRVDVTVLEKAKSMPHLRSSEVRFYQYAWFYHFRKLSWVFNSRDKLVVAAASVGTKKRSKAFREAVEDVVQQCTSFKVDRRVVALRDESDYSIQAVDYALWAVMRNREKGDDRSRRIIEDKIRSDFDLFARGSTYYY